MANRQDNIRVPREKKITLSPEEEENWSRWFHALAPEERNDERHEKRADGQLGWMRTGIRNEVLDYQGESGIYEWMASCTAFGHGVILVVYIGSTCGENLGFLSDKILGYCRNGSKKESKINQALDNQYDLWVRVKKAENAEAAQEMENALLEKYDYAWNERNNGEIRDILT